MAYVTSVGRDSTMSAPEFPSIRPKRLLESVIATLEEPLLNGTLKTGDMLPSEEQLAQQLGVGRRAVREALKVLETKGLVEVQMGIGTVVKRNDLDSFLDTLSRNVKSYVNIRRADVKHVMELRLLLEGAALERLATMPDEARLQRLAEAVANQRQALEQRDFQTYQEWHFRFHHEIIDTLENPVISMLYKQVMALMRESMERAGSFPERSTRAVHDHEQMLIAAQRGSPAEIRRVLNAHLEDFIISLQVQDESTG